MAASKKKTASKGTTVEAGKAPVSDRTFEKPEASKPTVKQEIEAPKGAKAAFVTINGNTRIDR